MKKHLSFAPLLLLLAMAYPALAQPTTTETPKQRLVDTVLANFSTWDQNGDGALDESELTHAVQDPKVVGPAAAGCWQR